MNNISNIAKGVLIGDGALAAFIEIGRNKNCGVGLFDYTTNLQHYQIPILSHIE